MERQLIEELALHILERLALHYRASAQGAAPT
jgi:hypothetical protein